MNFKKGVILCCSVAALVIGMTRIYSLNATVEQNLNEAIFEVQRAANNSSSEDEAYLVLDDAFQEYLIQFDSYIDITGLNVYNKESIELEEFNIDYVAPHYTTIMYDYQNSLETSFTTVELTKYEDFRRTNYDFDKYVSLIDNRFVDLSTRTKYQHNTASNNEPQIQYAAAAVTLTTILTSAGLSQGVIAAFTACANALTAALSSSVIPFVGWVIAVAIVVGALIALVVIIVQNWNAICNIMSQVQEWFLTEFSAFSTLINDFFSDAISKGEISTIAATEVIGGRKITWKDAAMTRDAAIAIATELRRDSENVFLMREISFPRPNEMSWWIATSYVDEQFVKSNKLYQAPYFYSTYTWYNSTAKRMLYEGTPSYSNYGGFGYKNIKYDRFTDMQDAIYGWNHYHVGKYNPTTNKVRTYKKEWGTPSIGHVHSFFGLTYIRLADNSGFTSFPTNP